MKRSKKYIVILILLFSVFFIVRKIIIQPLLQTEYNGIVTKRVFDIKGYSKFQIDNEVRWYDMLESDCDLQIGDSLVKKMNESTIYQYRNGVFKAKYNIFW